MCIRDSHSTTHAAIEPHCAVARLSPDGVLTAINKALFGGEMPDRLKGQLLTYLQVQPTPSATRVRETIALAMSSSTFQWI